MSTSLEALVTNSVSNKTKTILNELIAEALAGMKRLAAEAFVVKAATGKDASGSEQAITVNGLNVGDVILAVQSVNTVGGNAVWATTHYRSPVVAINTLNQLTTNHVGESLTVWALNRATR
jgi:hypothetical protein